MKKNRRIYTREFKLEAVRLAETSGKTQVEIERDLGIGAGCISRWKRELREEEERAFPGHGRSTKDDQVRRLERENEILRQERDILKKAMAIFSQPKR